MSIQRTIKCYPQMRKDIRRAAQELANELGGAEYLESNHRRLLARKLENDGYDVYQEVPMVFTFAGDPIPFGHGFIDICIKTTEGVVILELKVTPKNCRKQLLRYMNHWTHCRVLFGMTVNFTSGNVILEDVENTHEEKKPFAEGFNLPMSGIIKEETIPGC